MNKKLTAKEVVNHLKKLGYNPITNGNTIEFSADGNTVNYYPTKDWYQGKGLPSGRGFDNLLKELGHPPLNKEDPQLETLHTSDSPTQRERIATEVLKMYLRVEFENDSKNRLSALQFGEEMKDQKIRCNCKTAIKYADELIKQLNQ